MPEPKAGIDYTYDLREFSLSTAIDEMIEINAGYIFAYDATDATTNCTVRIDNKQNHPIPLRKGWGIVIKPGTSRLFIQASVQAGKTINLMFTTSYELFHMFEQATPTAEVSNIVQWGGTNIDGSYPARVIPLTGTQVTVSSTFAGVAATVLHTVTAGKTLYVIGGSLSGRGSGASSTRIKMAVRNGADVFQYCLIYMYLDSTNPGGNLPLTLMTPVEIAAGWDIYLQGEHADCEGAGCLQGWEQ